MQQISWRHHYIPEFYLKGFANENNQFAIYSTRDNKFKQDGKLFSPESHFFKKQDNTIDDLKKSLTDLLEKHYAELDSKFAPIFNKLNAKSCSHDYWK
ncbi:MAG: DUF4238 domain-containing protein [Ginsengibacter sp.]